MATTHTTSGDDTPNELESASAAVLLAEALAESYFGQLMRWLQARPDEPAQWQRAAFLGDRVLWLTPDELSTVGKDLLTVTDRYFDRMVRPELRPPGSRLVTYLHLGFPNVTLPADSAPQEEP